jgi:hypothetical protein
MAKNKGIKRFLRRTLEMLDSPAYRDLKPADRCLLEEFQRIFMPHRNGALSISTRNAMIRLNVSEPTAIKAFKNLETHGFIVLMKGQLWQQRKAREWRLTFEPCNGREPTDEWRGWRKSPTEKKGVIRPNISGQAAKELWADEMATDCALINNQQVNSK